MQILLLVTMVMLSLGAGLASAAGILYLLVRMMAKYR